LENNLKTPWHLWLVAIVAIIWNGFGAMDYYMTQSQNAEYMSAFTPEQIAYFEAFPIWVNTSWAIGIWSAVLGSILLLIRSRHAVLAFRLSIIGLILTATHNFVLAEVKMPQIVGQGALIFTAVIFLVALILFMYAKHMRNQGVLR
jgi:hypothetical protein